MDKMAKLSVKLTLVLASLLMVAIMQHVNAQSFGKQFTVKKGVVKEYTLSNTKNEKLYLEFLKPQSDFKLTVSKITTEQYLPSGFTPLGIFQFAISWNPTGEAEPIETYTAPIYNVVMRYSFSQTDLKKRGLEPEGIKFYYYNSDEATWMQFNSVTTINSIDSNAIQGASSLFDLKYTTETIAVLIPPVKEIAYAEQQAITAGEYNYFSVKDRKSSNKLKVMFNPLTSDGDWKVSIEQVKKLVPGTAMTKGLIRFDSSTKNYLGFKLVTESQGNAISTGNTTTGPKITYSQIIYDMTDNSAIADVIFSAKGSVVALQYDNEYETYFAVKTSWNGYVFYMEPRLSPGQTETFIYLTQVETQQPSGLPSTVPIIPNKDVFVPANVPYVAGLFYRVNSSRAYPLATFTFDKVERPFVAQVLQLTAENPLYSVGGGLPDSSKNESLVFFEVLIPSDTLEFSFKVQYDHRGNRVNYGVPIDRSTLQLLIMKDNKWTIVPKARISGATIYASITAADIMDKKTWFGVVAVTGAYTGISGTGVLSPSNLLSLSFFIATMIATFFMY